MSYRVFSFAMQSLHEKTSSAPAPLADQGLTTKLDDHRTDANDSSVHGEIIRLLLEQFTELGLKRPGFSLRAYAQMLGLNPTQLAETLKGRRPITRKIAIRAFERLGIDPDTGRGLIERLPAKQVRTKGAKAKLEKELGLKRTTGSSKKVQPKQSSVLQYIQLSTDEFRVIADWYYFAILSLAETKGFKSETGWIARRLDIQERDVKRAVECLVRLGLIERKPNGKLAITGKHFTTTNDIPNASIRKNHAQGLE